jgi:adenine-specific DNA-methyltransferase
VIERIIKASSNPGDLILDPFLGSGTTAASALKLNRKVVGFELLPEYCDIAVERITTLLSHRELPAQQSFFDNW